MEDRREVMSDGSVYVEPTPQEEKDMEDIAVRWKELAPDFAKVVDKHSDGSTRRANHCPRSSLILLLLA